MSEAPKRRYELKLSLSADSREELLRAWKQIEFEIASREYPSPELEHDMDICSGGVGSGWVLKVENHHGVTNASYFEAVEQWLDEKHEDARAE